MPVQMVQFLVAIGFGLWLGAARYSLGRSVAWTLGAALVLTVATTVIEGRRLPSAMKSPYGISFPRGLFSHLFFGTITTIAVAAVVAALVSGLLK